MINLKTFSKVVMVVLFALFNMGGCGGGDDEQPPISCNVPSFDTDFSNRVYFFEDNFNNLTFGVTSNGSLVLASIVFNGTNVPFAIAANLFNQDIAEVFEGNINLSSFNVPAQGIVARLNEGSSVVLQSIEFNDNGVIIALLPSPNESIGDCFEVQGAVNNHFDLSTLREVHENLLQQIGD